MLPRHFPRFNHIQPLEADLENMGSATSEFLPLASHEELMLDC
jgi:hypothetical protein